MSTLRRSNSTPAKRPGFLLLRDRNANLTPSPALSMPTVAEIPPDLQAVIDMTHTPPPSPGHRTVFLPLRYTQTIRKRNSYSSSSDGESSAGSSKPYIEISDKLSDKEKDLEQALKWLRQEVKQMKQQDRHLMRQLLDLRATIRQLEGIHSCQSVSGNLATMVGSPLISPGDAGDNASLPLQTKAVSMFSVTTIAEERGWEGTGQAGSTGAALGEERGWEGRGQTGTESGVEERRWQGIAETENRREKRANPRRSLDSVPPVVQIEEVGSPINI